MPVYLFPINQTGETPVRLFIKDALSRLLKKAPRQ